MSDWVIGKKLNSRIADVPLNHLIWLNDYKTYGEDSYVFQNKDMLHELYLDFRLSANDKQIAQESFGYVLASNNNLGRYIGDIYGICDTADWNTIQTLDNLLNNESAMVAMLDHSVAATMFLNNQACVDALLSSDQGMSWALSSANASMLLDNNQHLRDIVCANSSQTRTSISHSTQAYSRVEIGPQEERTLYYIASLNGTTDYAGTCNWENVYDYRLGQFNSGSRSCWHKANSSGGSTYLIGKCCTSFGVIAKNSDGYIYSSVVYHKYKY